MVFYQAQLPSFLFLHISLVNFSQFRYSTSYMDLDKIKIDFKYFEVAC